MTEELDLILKRLTPIQRAAVDWNDGSALILAGPGAGKTAVLTARIARLLDESRDRKFRILALTFTTKAALEMKERVEAVVSDLSERASISTFHAFCAETLRQHGSHIGIKTDFGIYNQKSDREALLSDALREAALRGEDVRVSDVVWLKAIDGLKSKLVVPETVSTQITNPTQCATVTKIYQIYEDALSTHNVLDFNGLILETCRLFRDFPDIAARMRRTYPYLLIDEFQDTSPAQSKLIRLLTGDEYKNVFVVADDDQIIFQWMDASYHQIELFRKNYQPELIQLVENHRCPPEIVDAANQLVAFNTRRTPDKKPTIAARSGMKDTITLRSFKTDVEECETIAAEIAALGETSWDKIAVLGRTRAFLGQFLEALKKQGVRAVLAQRRDQFVSPQFAWLQTCLDQAIRPTDKRVFAAMVGAANRFAGVKLDAAALMADAEAAGRNYFEHWGITISTSDPVIAKRIGAFAQGLARSRITWKKTVKEIIPILLETAGSHEGVMSDADEDFAAWNNCSKEIRVELGEDPDLAEFIQGVALRSKEPPPVPSTVSVLTVHSAKGLEFDFVYVIGLAESMMPSWQSIKEGDASAQMEEERRNCFVAVTRTREKLVLSRSERYSNRDTQPSRFLKEMKLIEELS